MLSRIYYQRISGGFSRHKTTKPTTNAESEPPWPVAEVCCRAAPAAPRCPPPMLQNGRLSALVSALGTAAGEGRTVAAEHGLQPRPASTAYVSKRPSAALTTLWPQTRRC